MLHASEMVSVIIKYVGIHGGLRMSTFNGLDYGPTGVP